MQPDREEPQPASRAEKLLAAVFGVVFLAVILYAALREEQIQGATKAWMLNVVAAISASGFAALIPGFLNLSVKHKTLVAIRSGGALAVFVLVFVVRPVPYEGKVCIAGKIDDCKCGYGVTGVQTCMNGGYWGPCENCPIPPLSDAALEPARIYIDCPPRSEPLLDGKIVTNGLFVNVSPGAHVVKCDADSQAMTVNAESGKVVVVGGGGRPAELQDAGISDATPSDAEYRRAPTAVTVVCPAGSLAELDGRIVESGERLSVKSGEHSGACRYSSGIISRTSRVAVAGTHSVIEPESRVPNVHCQHHCSGRDTISVCVGRFGNVRLLESGMVNVVFASADIGQDRELRLSNGVRLQVFNGTQRHASTADFVVRDFSFTAHYGGFACPDAGFCQMTTCSPSTWSVDSLQAGDVISIRWGP